MIGTEAQVKWPPNHIAPVAACIDTGGKQAGAILQSGAMLEQQMQAARAGAVQARIRQAGGVTLQPFIRFRVLGAVDIEHKESRGLARRHAYERAGMFLPEQLERFRLRCRILEAVRTRRPLIGQSGKCWDAVPRQPESFVHGGAAHDALPLAQVQ
jgi:hypothetical protein